MMQGDPKVDELMRPVHAAIKRHVKDGDAVTDIYNRAYEALMISMDVIDTSAKVAAKQIAENAKNLQRAEAAEARAERLQKRLADRDAEVARLTELQRAASEFIGYIKAGNNAKAHLQMLFLEVLINEESKNGAKK